MNVNEMSMEASITMSKATYLMIKRVFDVVVSLFAIIALSPLFLLTIIAIRIDSKGKAIYTQDRIGLNGKLFKLYKFRSMVEDADKQLEEILAKDDVLALEYRINKKFKNALCFLF